MRHLPGVGILVSLCACTMDGELPHSRAPAGSLLGHSAAFYSRLAGEHLERIVGSDLRRLVVGSTITPRERPSNNGPSNGAPVVSVPSYDRFERDGTYVHGVENVRGSGRYDVTGDVVCSHLDIETRCRTIFRTRSGAFFLSYADMADSLMAVSITHVPLRQP